MVWAGGSIVSILGLQIQYGAGHVCFTGAFPQHHAVVTSHASFKLLVLEVVHPMHGCDIDSMDAECMFASAGGGATIAVGLQYVTVLGAISRGGFGSFTTCVT